MNRGVFESLFPVHQMVGGSPPIWWDLNNMGPPGDHTSSPLLIPSSSNSSTTPSSSSSSALPQYYTHSSTLQPMTSSWPDHQELPDSWSQLLLGGLVEEEEMRGSYTATLQAKRMEEDIQVLYPISASNSHAELSHDHKGGYWISDLEIQAAARSSWSSSQILPNSSPRSCVTNSSSMLDFSNNYKAQKRHHQLDLSSECNSTPTGSPYKKPRVLQAQSSNFKVRKEKLGDRITALHQIVSPFGKTDTASVLLETIGYIRFLQSQIEALTSPYLGGSSSTGSGGNIKHSADGVNEPMKDLKSRGLCLLPVSFMMNVGNENAADYWAPAFGGGFL